MLPKFGWRPGRYSLRLALTTFVLVPVVIALILVGLAAQKSVTDWAERRMKEEVDLVASTIRLPLGRALAAGRVKDVERALRSAIRTDPIYAVFVYDARGVPLASIGEEPLPITVDVFSRVVIDGEKVQGYTRLDERRVYSVSLPLRGSAGETVGILQVIRRRRDFDREIAGLRRQAAFVLLISCLGVSALLLWGHDRAVGSALRRLEEDIGRIDRGKEGHRAGVAGPREVAGVTTALNTMLERRERDEAEISARRKKQGELEEQLRHAEKLAAIGQLASGLAHELGTPLSVIDGYAQRELRRQGSAENSKRVMAGVRRQVERMSAIVRQLLDFARRSRARPTRVEVGRIVDSAISAVAQTPGRDVTDVRVECPQQGVWAHADPAALERVVINLVENGVQAAEGGNVRISCEEVDGKVLLRVEDDGHGVPTDLRKKIFEPFFTTKAVGEGTGLGLAVVHGLTEEQGGRVDVGESVLGGAKFEITLPLSEEGGGL